MMSKLVSNDEVERFGRSIETTVLGYSILTKGYVNLWLKAEDGKVFKVCTKCKDVNSSFPRKFPVLIKALGDDAILIS